MNPSDTSIVKVGAVTLTEGVGVGDGGGVGDGDGVEVGAGVRVGSGGGHPAPTTSSAPMSGHESLSSLSKSSLTPVVAVAYPWTGDSDARCRFKEAVVPVGFTSNGLTESDASSRPVAACHCMRSGRT